LSISFARLSSVKNDMSAELISSGNELRIRSKGWSAVLNFFDKDIFTMVVSATVTLNK
jgi:hypothetical protein